MNKHLLEAPADLETLLAEPLHGEIIYEDEQLPAFYPCVAVTTSAYRSDNSNYETKTIFFVYITDFLA